MDSTWNMHDQKYVEGLYGGFDLKGQSSRVKGQIFKMLQLNWKLSEMNPYDLLSMLKILIN